jgi:hypothetical protein
MNGKDRSSRGAARLGPLLIAAVVVACGGGPVPSPSDQANNETPAPSKGTKPTPTDNPTATPEQPDPTPQPKRPVAGEIDFITTDEGTIDDVVANKGDKIRERQILRTNDEGSLTFSVIDGIKLCNMYENAQAEVKPSKGVPIHLDGGEFSCEATPSSGPVKVLVGPDMELELSEPQFIVSIGDEGTTIRVLTGLIDVHSLSDGTNMLLGPMESTDTNAGAGVLAPVRIWEPAEIENPKLLADISKFDTGRNLTMPDVGSVALDRMGESGSINVGVPEGLAGDQASLDFVNGFLDEQAKDWNLEGGSTPQVVGEQDVAAALEQGTIDMFISSEDLPGLGQIPLFVDPSGQQFWLYYDPNDEAFGAAQEEYVSNAVIDESYRQVYVRELGSEPVYEGVDELFGLQQ